MLPLPPPPMSDDLLRFVRLLALPPSHPAQGELAGWLQTHTLQKQDALWLHGQGLAPYTYNRLTQLELMELVPPEGQKVLHKSYRGNALYDAAHFEIVTHTLGALNRSGIDSILMKGVDLAHRVYPNPRCRPMSDVDLWVRSEQIPQALQILQQSGFTLVDEGMGIKNYEHYQLCHTSSSVSALELQGKAIRHHWYWIRITAKIDHDAVWARRQPFCVAQHTTNVLAPEDLLCHLSIHQGVNHLFHQPWLRALLDIHLLIQTLPLDWATLVAQAQAWQVRSVLWTILSLTQHFFDSAIPTTALEALTPPPIQRYLINRLHLKEVVWELAPLPTNHKRALIMLAMVDQPSAAVQLLARSIFPDPEWIQAHYQPQSTREMWQARLLHPWRTFLSRQQE